MSTPFLKDFSFAITIILFNAKILIKRFSTFKFQKGRLSDICNRVAAKTFVILNIVYSNYIKGRNHINYWMSSIRYKYASFTGYRSSWSNDTMILECYFCNRAFLMPLFPHCGITLTWPHQITFEQFEKLVFVVCLTHQFFVCLLLTFIVDDYNDVVASVFFFFFFVFSFP